MNQDQFERALRALESGQGEIRPSDVVLLPEPLRSVLNRAVRMGRISLTDFAGELGIDRDQAARITEILVARELFRISPLSDEKEAYFETRMSALTRPLTRPASDLWKKIDD